MDTAEAAWVNYRVGARRRKPLEYRPLVETDGWRFLVPVAATIDVEVTGHRCLSRVVVDVELIDRGYRETRIELTARPDGQTLDFYDLRAPLRCSWEQAGIAHLARLVSPTGQTFDVDRPVPDADPMMNVALTYATAASVNAPPVQFVAERFGISPGAAAQRVKRARDAGYLPPTTPGTVS
jgi:hypothetical protein